MANDESNSDFEDEVVEEEESSSMDEVEEEEAPAEVAKEAEGAKRHAKLNKPQRDAITNNAATRLCLKAGAPRHRKDVKEAFMETTEDFLHDVLYDAAVCMNHARRKTFLLKDIKFALERQNIKLYA